MACAVLGNNETVVNVVCVVVSIAGDLELIRATGTTQETYVSPSRFDLHCVKTSM